VQGLTVKKDSSYNGRVQGIKDKLAVSYKGIKTHGIIQGSKGLSNPPSLLLDSTKGCGSRIATLTMVFKLILSAQKRWKKLKGHRKIKQVWEGVKFEDGLIVKEPERLEEIAT